MDLLSDHTLHLTLTLIVQTCGYLVIAYLFVRTRLFLPFMHASVRPLPRFACYLVFSLFCIMGTYLGTGIDDSIANTRAIGAVLGGALGGPLVGFAVGLTGGLHRYSIGGPTAFACMISTVVEGLAGGCYHWWMVRHGRLKHVLQPLGVALVAFAAELAQMGILLAMVRPVSAAERLVGHIALPMLLANTFGAGMFVSVLLDRRKALERQSSIFSAQALRIAARAEGAFRSGFNAENATRVARIVYEETGVGAVAITDRDKVLAFIGIGHDHHHADMPIVSPQTIEAIENNVVVFADGNEVGWQCPINPAKCPIGAALVIPLVGEADRVIGTITLGEPRTKLFSTINRALGEGIARLLSTQILAGRYEDQKRMLVQSELKLLQAQVNPHFLFNALNTLAAIVGNDPKRARQFVQNLSTFLRKNLKRPSEEVTLEDELEHVGAYLEIEKARFAGRLDVHIDIPAEYAGVRLPAFAIQPIVENAIKHGTSQLIGKGEIRVSAERDGEDLLIHVDDNAGLYCERQQSGGLGMKLVSKRLESCFGPNYGTSVSCNSDVSTRVTLRVPLCGCLEAATV
jgi:two-component system LytT family sensor kinase